MIRQNATKLFFIACCLLMAGCARTVTQVAEFGSQMRVQITFRDTIDLAANRYFLVLGSSESFSVPLPPPNSQDEFLEPGDSPQTGNIADYYAKYYSGWLGYAALDQTGYYISKGPYSFGQSATREVLSTLPAVSSAITFVFRLDQIYGASIPDTIYFDLVCAGYQSGALKQLKDHAAPPVRNISKIVSSQVSESEEQDMTIDGGQDIIQWSVKIE